MQMSSTTFKKTEVQFYCQKIKLQFFDIQPAYLHMVWAARPSTYHVVGTPPTVQRRILYCALQCRMLRWLVWMGGLSFETVGVQLFEQNRTFFAKR